MISRLRAQAGGDKTYASLAAGTIAHWIDFSGRAPRWQEHILEKVKLEGQRAVGEKRLGRPRVLVSSVHFLAGIHF
jgi:hypothetical protein